MQRRSGGFKIDTSAVGCVVLCMRLGLSQTELTMLHRARRLSIETEAALGGGDKMSRLQVD